MTEFEILSELLQRLIEVINSIINRYVIIVVKHGECRFLCTVNHFILFVYSFIYLFIYLIIQFL